MQLRPYQQAAIDSVYEYLRSRDDNPCAVIPTAGGKTPIMATICRDAVVQWNGRVLILAHVKELLEQTADKLRAVCPDVDFGIYSAGLKRRDTNNPIIVAGIQSVYRRACELDAFDLVMVDEAHLIPLDGDGMYRQFLADAKVVNPNLHARGGEFVADEVESLMDQESLVQAACSEIVEYTADRKACLIFSSGVQHGQHIVETLEREHGIRCGFVTGETATSERDETLTRFKAGELKYLCNVNVLTTGFDAPHIDCVALLRPTMSPGLYYQMVGRGFRLHPSKENCLVLDFGGNVLRHGPVDQIRITQRESGSGPAPAKECPECQAVVAAGFTSCPQCGFVFPPPERQQHDSKASEEGILSGQVTKTKHPVLDVSYSVHSKRGADEDAPRTLRVDYRIGWNQYKSEWICLEHAGYARGKAVAWWKQRSPDPVPDTIERAVDIASGGGLATTASITVRAVAGEQYERIIDYELGEPPEPLTAMECDAYDPDEIPF
jgi:DNA repair protein RadD